MQCPQCQHENREGAKFCNECATPLSLRCPSCETLNPPGAKFCDECATPLTTSTPAPTPTRSAPPPAVTQERDPTSYTPQHLAEKILTSRSTLEGERKQVTVMFADIKDSTKLIRDLDPEAAQQLLDPAIHIMMDAVHRFEGTVNQVLGDGVMAIFGAPIAHEDHAARACYAALAMQAAMRDYTEEARRSRGLTLRIRVGLNSGEVVVRNIGNDLHMDYSAVGQTTNLASRMEQLAAPGSITLTATTLRLVEGLVRVNDLGLIPVKGMGEPVDVYELREASSIRRRLQAAVVRGLTKFIGRDTEIEVLNQALEQAKAGNGQVVAVVAEAGVGKSRFVYEFIHSHRTPGWLVLESASVSYGKATPYFPVIDLLKRYVHVEDSDDPRTIRAKVTGQILSLDESLQGAIPPLLSLLDALPDDSPFLQLDPHQRRQHTLNGLKRILLRESQVQPLLLVFEDLHWIDSETQALLDSLVESLPTTQLLLLVNYRPEYQHSWGSKTFYTQLRLDPLPSANADEFLAGLLGNDASLEPLKKLLIERTAGNPFFLEESVRTLVETQMLVGESGSYRLALDVTTLQVPATVQAVLAARIDRLSPEAKQVLQTAAVIGNEVPLAVLRAIAKVSEDSLYQSLIHLQGAEFVYEIRLFPEQVYTFKHALTHEVAYGSLLQERRRVLHARIVETLEILSGDRLADQVERLAHHALRGELWNKAVTYLRQAGAKAMERSANREAVAQLEQALEALQHLPDSSDTMAQGIDVRLALRNALVSSFGNLGRIIDYLREAEVLAEALGDHRRLGWIFSFMAHYFRLQEHDYENALACAERALALATAHEDLFLAVDANFRLGMIHYRLGNYHQAMPFYTKVVTSLEGDLLYERRSSGPGPLSAISCAMLANCFAELGVFTEGIACNAKGIQIAETVQDPLGLIIASHASGILAFRQGDFPKSIREFEHCVSLEQDTHIDLLSKSTTAFLGLTYALRDRFAEALPLLDKMQQQVVRGRTNSASVLSTLSEGYLLAGRREAALTLAEQAHRIAFEDKELGVQAWSLRLLGDIAMQSNPPEINQAEIHYQQALTIANELGMRPLQAHCHRGLGRLYSQAGKLEQACAELSTAIEMYRDMEMTFWLPETEAALAEVEKR